MNNVVGFTCVICGTTYPADFAGYVCPDHGNEGILSTSKQPFEVRLGGRFGFTSRTLELRFRTRNKEFIRHDSKRMRKVE